MEHCAFVEVLEKSEEKVLHHVPRIEEVGDGVLVPPLDISKNAINFCPHFFKNPFKICDVYFNPSSGRL